MKIPEIHHCILIAGTGSGTGKTSVTLALARALVRLGHSVQPFKVGPDYLDPTYLSLAAGRTCYNLDTWMCGRDYVASLVAEKCSDGSIAVIEGAMGLFDGVRPDSSEGSAAEIAALLGSRVLLVADAKGQGRSFAAGIKGFASFESHVRIAGVIANFCGSKHHVALLAKALESEGLPPLVGGLEKGALPLLKSRHLGLVTADSNDMEHTMDALADAFTASIPVDRILNLINQGNIASSDTEKKASEHRQSTTKTESKACKRLRLGIAEDTAFHFYYPDNLQAFEDVGFTLVPFSPVSDTNLPDGLDALYIGGGYPELGAQQLSKNTSMQASIRSFCRHGRPVYAECGGLMYLCDGIVTADGKTYGMAGVLPGVCKMQKRIGALGYAEVVLLTPSLFGEVGTRLRGHTFHYSVFDDSLLDESGWHCAYDVRLRKGSASGNEGYQKGNVLISYMHLHLASHPSALAHFRQRCLRCVEETKRSVNS